MALAGEKDLLVTLHYEVNASSRDCWDEAKFRRGVSHRIGYDPFRENAQLNLSVRVGGSAQAVDGQVEWRNASGAAIGERKFIAKDGNCNKLMTEMSFAVGLQIEFLHLRTPKPEGADAGPPSPAPDPNSVSPSTKDESPPTEAHAPAPVSSPTSEEQVSPASPETNAEPEIVQEPSSKAPPQKVATSQARPSIPWSMWVGAGPAVAWRLSPNATADGRLFFGLGSRFLSFEVGAEATYPSTLRRWDGSGFRQNLIGATAAVCGHLNRFSACGLGRIGQVRVTGLGVDKPRSPNGLVAQAGARLAAVLYTIGPFSMAAHVDGLALLTASTVRLNQSAVWEMPRLGGVAGIDILWRFR